MNNADAWGDFWANNSGASQTQGGCLPDRWAAIEDAQMAAWHSFIADLPQGARLLDLATGDGRVLRWMRAKRSDLDLIGIDLAPQIPPAPEGTETRGGIAMENLPFESGEFTAVVSQFGFEYGDTASVANEIARVLAPHGTGTKRAARKVGLLVHRGDGPILEHNNARRAAIDWAVSEKNVAGLVANALQSPDGGSAVAGQVAAAMARLGAYQFGEQSPAWEIPEALRRAVVMGENAGPEATLETIEAITRQAQNEVGRIESLARACATADAREALVDAFEKHGLMLQSTAAIAEPSGRTLADFLIFS